MSEDNLQQRYWAWNTAGLDLGYQFFDDIKKLIVEIYALEAANPREEQQSLRSISLVDDDTFKSVWIDDQNRPCCSAKIDDGAPMGWRVEFLSLEHRRELHELLLRFRDELRNAP